MLLQHITRPWAKRLAHDGLRTSLRVNTAPELATHGRTAFWTCYRYKVTSGSVTLSQKRAYHKVTNHYTTLKFRPTNPSPHFPLTPSTRSHSSQTSSIASMSPVPATGAPDEYRLPINVKPTHYDLTVRTDLDKHQFEGFVKIRCVSVSTIKR
jgi:hypothetical protein